MVKKGLNVSILKIRPLGKFCPKISIYKRDFDEAKYMSFLIKDEMFLINVMKFGKKWAILLKRI